MGREQRQEGYSGPVSPIFRLLTTVRGQGKSCKRHFTEISCVVFWGAQNDESAFAQNYSYFCFDVISEMVQFLWSAVVTIDIRPCQSCPVWSFSLVCFYSIMQEYFVVDRKSDSGPFSLESFWRLESKFSFFLHCYIIGHIHSNLSPQKQTPYLSASLKYFSNIFVSLISFELWYICRNANCLATTFVLHCWNYARMKHLSLWCYQILWWSEAFTLL